MMNRRDLFKRAGKLGLGLGLGAVVGTGVTGESEGFSGAATVSGSLGDGYEWRGSTTLQINEHKYQPFEVETLTSPTADEIDGALIRTWNEAVGDYARRTKRQGGAL